MIYQGLLRRFSRQATADASWTFVNNVGSAAATLATVRAITFFISTKEYGRASLSLGVIALLNQFIMNPIFTGRLRDYFTGGGLFEASDYRQIVIRESQTGALVSTVAYAVIAAIFVRLGEPAYLALLLPAILIIVAQPYLTATLTLLEAQRKYKQQAMAQTLSKAAVVPLVIILARHFATAATVLVATGLALACVAIGYGLAFRPSPVLSSARAPVMQGSTIAKSLYVFNVVSWIMTTSDRYIIDWFRMPAEVGIYAINYGFWFMPFQLLNAWLETLFRVRIYSRAAEGNWVAVQSLTTQRVKLTLYLSTCGALALLAVGKPVASWILGERFWGGVPLMIALVSAHWFYTLGNAYFSLFVAANRVRAMLNATIVVTIVNVALNLVFIPRFGFLAAGVSTLVTYAIWALLLYLSANFVVRTAATQKTLAPVE